VSALGRFVVLPDKGASSVSMRTIVAPRASTHSQRATPIRALAVVAMVYLALTLSYSLLTPAWEANDEVDHIGYVEYIVEHGSLPRIGAGIESVQPPLYYLAVMAWQRALRIPAFSPEVSPPSGQDPLGLQVNHDYTYQQRVDAVRLHRLRLISVGFGLVTVVAAYGVAMLSTRRRDVAAASALFVAVLPKFNVVSATVQNDSLAIACCAVALWLLLAWRQSEAIPGRGGRWLAAGVGLACGLAALAKYTSLPVLAVLGLLMVVEGIRRRRQGVLDVGIAAGTAVGVAGWWFVRNIELYGQPLAQRPANAYVSQVMGNLADPVPWLDQHRFLVFLPTIFVRSIWYDGGWNQWQLPPQVNLMLTGLAALALAGGLRVVLWRRGSRRLRVEPRAEAALAAVLAAAVAALLIIVRSTTQAEGRYTYVGVTAFAVLIVIGSAQYAGRSQLLRRAALWVWPVLMLGVQVLVWRDFLLRYRGL
jgi:hypothetical protein